LVPRFHWAARTGETQGLSAPCIYSEQDGTSRGVCEIGDRHPHPTLRYSKQCGTYSRRCIGRKLRPNVLNQFIGASVIEGGVAPVALIFRRVSRSDDMALSEPPFPNNPFPHIARTRLRTLPCARSRRTAAARERPARRSRPRIPFPTAGTRSTRLASRALRLAPCASRLAPCVKDP
jgi:hypothetical protein